MKYTCQLPIAANCTFLPLKLDKSDFNPEAEDACAVQSVPVDYTAGLQEVKFGRGASPGRLQRSSTSRTGRPSSQSTSHSQVNAPSWMATLMDVP